MIVFSNEWADALKVSINENVAYKEAAAKWNDGLLLVLGKDKKVNAADNPAIYLDLQHGDCLAARIANEADFETAAYILVANTKNWESILEGKVAPLSAIMRGKLKLAKGSMATLARYVNAAKEIVVSAQSLDSEIPQQFFDDF